MSTDEPDPLLTRLRELPGPQLPPLARARALHRAEVELHRRPARAWSLARWLGTEALVPSVLVMAGLLYLTGAVRELAHVFGPAHRRTLAQRATEQVVPRSARPRPAAGRGDRQIPELASRLGHGKPPL